MKDELKIMVLVMLFGMFIGLFMFTVKHSQVHNFKRIDAICKDICKK